MAILNDYLTRWADNISKALRVKGEVKLVESSVGIDQTTPGLTNAVVPIDVNGDEKFTEENPAVVQLSGSKAEELLDQDDAVDNILTFSSEISSIEIYHEEVTPQIFIVNGLSLKIASGGWRSPVGGVPSPYVQIPAGINCIIARLV